jgi:2-aminoethylphosphonate-pyruvate transaminase
MPHQDNLLLTPGPLTTGPEVRQAMQRDWGSRDEDFIALIRRVRDRLTGLAHAGNTHTCIPIQGSGTFAIEAALGTFVPRDGKLLIIANGAYGQRAGRIMDRLNRRYELMETAENELPVAEDITSQLREDPAITDVFLVHCETTSGILNPLEKIAAVVKSSGRRFILDAMSSFGGIPIDLSHTPIDVLAASSNKCLEGVPGVGFVLARNDLMTASKGCSPSLCLDLHDQWRVLEDTGQWRFTPPTHVLAALDAALDTLETENGVTGRFARYWENCRILVDGLRMLGFETLLPDTIQAPIIVTFREPADPAYDFNAFYAALQHHGFSIYPGKLTEQPSFRVGCIGRVTATDMTRFVAAVEDVLKRGNIANCGPV